MKEGSQFVPPQQYIDVRKVSHDVTPIWKSTVSSGWVIVKPRSGRAPERVVVRLDYLVISKFPVGVHHAFVSIWSNFPMEIINPVVEVTLVVIGETGSTGPTGGGATGPGPGVPPPKYMCTECGAEFFDAGELAQHIAEMHPESTGPGEEPSGPVEPPPPSPPPDDDNGGCWLLKLLKQILGILHLRRT